MHNGLDKVKVGGTAEGDGGRGSMADRGSRGEIRAVFATGRDIERGSRDQAGSLSFYLDW